VVIVQRDTTVIDTSFGLRDRERGLQFDTATAFLLGSVTKPLVAFAVQSLVDEGKLSLEDNVSRWFPTYPSAEQITIGHLLDHKAGIPDYDELPGLKEYAADSPSPRETINRLAALTPYLPPGVRYHFSNAGYIMLGVITEEVSRKPLAQFIKERVLDAFGLGHTGVASASGQPLQGLESAAVGYRSTPCSSATATPPELAVPFATENMYSTPHDLLAFCRAMVYRGVLPRAEQADEWILEHQPYTKGWGMRNINDVLAIGHFGAISGYSASVMWLPMEEAYVVFCCNDDHVPYRTISEDLATLVASIPVPNPEMEAATSLTAAQRAACIGTYVLGDGFTLAINDVDGTLMLTEAGQGAVAMCPIGKDWFCFADLERHVKLLDMRDGVYRQLLMTDLRGEHAITAWRTP
jgi:CubicO group peptidase (beta-lactamase class C family)